MNTSQHKHIVVEGPIGVGKTCLVKKLATYYCADAIVESENNNPFLEKFYQNRGNTALSTQLHFLFTRANQLTSMRQHDLFRPVQICDFLAEKDRLFALINLDDDELQLYEKIYSMVIQDTPCPDIIVYLQASTETLLKRIRNRANKTDEYITRDYLQTVSDAYMHFFFNFDKAPLLIVNTEHIDFVKNDHDFLRLASQIDIIQSGIHYFNPLNIL